MPREMLGDWISCLWWRFSSQSHKQQFMHSVMAQQKQFLHPSSRVGQLNTQSQIQEIQGEDSISQCRHVGRLEMSTGRKPNPLQELKASDSHCHKHNADTFMSTRSDPLFPGSTLVTSEGLCALTPRLSQKMSIHPQKGKTQHLAI